MSTSDFAQLIEDHFPATAKMVREWCEDGTIPKRFAKRPPLPPGANSDNMQRHWRIAVRGVRHILETILEMEPDEVAEVLAKKPKLNFSQVAA
jgi:hypothetical protein